MLCNEGMLEDCTGCQPQVGIHLKNSLQEINAGSFLFNAHCSHIRQVHLLKETKRKFKSHCVQSKSLFSSSTIIYLNTYIFHLVQVAELVVATIRGNFYVTEVFLRCLEEGQVVVLDHKHKIFITEKKVKDEMTLWSLL